MPLLVIPIIWIAMVLGRRISRLVLGGESADALPLELTAFGSAIGMGILAYGIMAIGLTGHLRSLPIVLLVVIMAVAGWREHGVTLTDLRSAIRSFRPTLVGRCLFLGFVLFALVAVIECLAPPTPMEWDSLSYHLADPKIYLHYGRLLYLPWESHSNFAFTMEMLYTTGLMLGSTASAKAFHLAMAIIASLSVYLIGARHIGSNVGKLAALLFASAPLVFWEAGTAYVDLGATAYGALALLAVLNGLRDTSRGRWYWLAAIALGLMLSVKATSAITVVLLCAWILIARAREPGRGLGLALRTAVMVGVVAAIIGCPWYIKSAIYTGNPVYPFGYSLFGGRYWSAQNASSYNDAQKQFGVGHVGPQDKRLAGLAELILAPWNLVMYSMPEHVSPAGSKQNPFNDFPSVIVSLSPFLLAALFVPAFLWRSLSVPVRALGVYALVSAVIWFGLTQQVRYLLPVLVPLSLVSVACMDSALRERRISGSALGVVFGVSLLASVLIGLRQIGAVGPVATGRQSDDAYLTRHFASYGAMQYLNSLPFGTRVIFYGEPLGFYCNQPYMWGEQGHSTLIPYDSLGGEQALRDYLLAHKIDYILWNTAGFQPSSTSGWDRWVANMLNGPGSSPVYVNARGTIAVFRLTPVLARH